MTEQRKAWQEPMVWLMAGIPALTVVAGITTLIIALQSGPMDLIPAAVQRVAQAQTLDSAEDQTAADGNYRAYLIIEQGTQPWSISVKTIPMSLAEKDMRLVFVHPNRADRDIDVLLPANVGKAVMRTPIDFVAQQIILSDSKKTWRLVGQYNSISTITLTPAQPVQ
jgi:uncharacterized protein